MRWRPRGDIVSFRDDRISFDGVVTGLLPLGARRVRLENGHVITVLPSLNRPLRTSVLGDEVRVEIGFNQLKGWRLTRRPDTPVKGRACVASG